MKHQFSVFAVCLSTATLFGCQRAESNWKPAAVTNKAGSEQTEGPGTTARFAQNAEDIDVHDRPSPVIRFQPFDLTSNVGETPLSVEIETFGVPFAKSAVDGLMNQLKLVTWPEGKAVGFTTSVVDETGNVYGPNGFERRQVVRVVIQPKTELRGGWHALTLRSVPGGVKLPKFSTHHTLPDGSVGARFSVDSDPTVSAVRVCTRGARRSMQIDFSERISTQPVFDGQLRVAGATGCTPELRADEQSVETVSYTCESLPDNAEVTIEADQMTAIDSGKGVAAKLGASGAQAGSTAGLKFRYGKLSPWQDGCRIYRP